MPLAWLIVEINDRELPVVREGECPSAVERQLIL
jgi:hypothetical protein